MVRIELVRDKIRRLRDVDPAKLHEAATELVDVLDTFCAAVLRYAETRNGDRSR